MPFIPHTDDEIRQMLATIGVGDTDALFDEIPAELRTGALEAIPPGLSEMEVGRLMTERAARDGRRLNFIGAGAYEHHIPAAIWAIVARGEFYSAYTPYQAEASQRAAACTNSDDDGATTATRSRTRRCTTALGACGSA
jgi:glycine dehydrogenase subunit 1